jgi:hypothetical protein
MKNSFYAWLLLICWTAFPAAFAAVECPEGSKLVETVDTGNKIQYYCECLPGRTLVGKQCVECTPELTRQLQNRFYHARKGMISSLRALRQQSIEVGMEELGNQVTLKLLPATARLANPKVAAKAIAAGKSNSLGLLWMDELVETAVAESDKFLTDFKAQIDAHPDMRPLVDNYENFKNMMIEASAQLSACKP